MRGAISYYVQKNNLLACLLFLEIFITHSFYTKYSRIIVWYLTVKDLTRFIVILFDIWNWWLHLSWIGFLIFGGLYIRWANISVLNFHCPLGSFKKKKKPRWCLGLNPRDSNLIGLSHGLRSKSFKVPQVILIFRPGLEPPVSIKDKLHRLSL